MLPYLSTDRATLYHARAEEVYPLLDAGSISMIWSDGPYAMNKADWDRMGVDGLADWYAPHIEAWGRICAPSATVYLWNTAEGWARIDPVMRAAGWTFRVLVAWDKGIAQATNYHMTWEQWRYWPEITEVCGFYQRTPGLAGLVARLRRDAGIDQREAARRVVGSASGAVWNWENGLCEPTLDNLIALVRACGAPWSIGQISAEYEAARVPFTCPVGVSNVWRHPQVSGRERITIDGQTHPCQKPLAFADRAILASTRVGDTILDPFAGTNRIAVACRRLPEEERRHAIGIEMEQRWLDAVRPSLVADHGHTGGARQAGLFT